MNHSAEGGRPRVGVWFYANNVEFLSKKSQADLGVRKHAYCANLTDANKREAIRNCCVFMVVCVCTCVCAGIPNCSNKCKLVRLVQDNSLALCHYFRLLTNSSEPV